MKCDDITVFVQYGKCEFLEPTGPAILAVEMEFQCQFRYCWWYRNSHGTDFDVSETAAPELRGCLNEGGASRFCDQSHGPQITTPRMQALHARRFCTVDP